MRKFAFVAVALAAAMSLTVIFPAEAALVFGASPGRAHAAITFASFAMVPGHFPRGVQSVRAALEPRAVRRANANANEILAEMQETMDGWMANHDQRLDAFEKELNVAASARAGIMLGGGGGTSSLTPAAMKAEREGLGQFVRSGEMNALSQLAPNAKMSANSDPDGGYTVMPMMADAIRQKVWDISPLGRLARYQPIGTGDSFEEPYDTDEADAEWVEEEEARTERNTPKLRLFTCPLHEIYTNQAVTQRLLDDSSYNMGAWLMDKISTKFARKEGAAFVGGDGVKKPRGILQYPTDSAGDATRAKGTLQYRSTGAASTFAVTSPGDALLDLVYSLRAPYRPNARWLMNLATAGMVRKFKDAEGRYIWAESAAAGQPPTLLGFPVELDEEMPNVASNAFPIAFGDFAQGYTVIDRPGMKVLRDPFTAKPNVMFYAYRRVGGGVHDSEAIKLLKVSVS